MITELTAAVDVTTSRFAITWKSAMSKVAGVKRD